MAEESWISSLLAIAALESFLLAPQNGVESSRKPKTQRATEGQTLRDINQVLLEKQAAIAQVKVEIEALKRVISLGLFPLPDEVRPNMLGRKDHNNGENGANR